MTEEQVRRYTVPLLFVPVAKQLNDKIFEVGMRLEDDLDIGSIIVIGFSNN